MLIRNLLVLRDALGLLVDRRLEGDAFSVVRMTMFEAVLEVDLDLRHLQQLLVLGRVEAHGREEVVGLTSGWQPLLDEIFP